MEPLTRRQQDILHYIADVIAARKASPTLKETASAFGISISNVQKYVAALGRKGYLTVERHAHRGIRLTRSRREWRVRRAWRGDFEERIGAKLRAETDLRRIFAIVRDGIRAWMDVERAELFVHEPQRRELRASSFYEVHPAGTAGTDPPAGAVDPVVGAALRKRKAVVEGSVAAFPVPGRDRALGVLRLEARGGGAGFDEAKVARAAMAAAALSPALEQGTLHEELRHRIRLQSALVTLIRTINSTADLPNILRDVYGIVGGLVDAPCFMIAVTDDEGRWWLLMSTDHADGRVVEDFTPHPVIPVDNPALRVIRDHPYYILHRTPEQIREMEGIGAGPTKDGWSRLGVPKRSRSILYVPLKTGGEAIGYLSVQSYAYNAYSLRDADDLILIGEYIGLALQGAWRKQTERVRLASAQAILERFRGLDGELARIAARETGAVRGPLEALAALVEVSAGRP